LVESQVVAESEATQQVHLCGILEAFNVVPEDFESILMFSTAVRETILGEFFSMMLVDFSRSL